MDIAREGIEAAEEMAALFATTFGASEGPEEGQLIGTLARGLLATTPDGDLRAFCAREAEGRLVGCILFTRMDYARDPRRVFVLAPVAVAPDRQGRGVGPALIRHGLDALRSEGVDVALTYGNPAFYGRLGFRAIAQEAVAAPFPLQFPHGWLGQSLTDAPLAPLPGPVRCAPALDDPAYW
jgi:predicted N-acetyltransferase YhbS